MNHMSCHVAGGIHKAGCGLGSAWPCCAPTWRVQEMLSLACSQHIHHALSCKPGGFEVRGEGVVSGLSAQSHLPCFIPLPDGHCHRLSRSMRDRYTLEQFCASHAQACTKFNVDFVVVEGSMKHKKKFLDDAVALSAVAMQSTSALDSMMQLRLIKPFLGNIIKLW